MHSCLPNVLDKRRSARSSQFTSMKPGNDAGQREQLARYKGQQERLAVYLFVEATEHEGCCLVAQG